MPEQWVVIRTVTEGPPCEHIAYGPFKSFYEANDFMLTFDDDVQVCAAPINEPAAKDLPIEPRNGDGDIGDAFARMFGNH